MSDFQLKVYSAVTSFSLIALIFIAIKPPLPNTFLESIGYISLLYLPFKYVAQECYKFHKDIQ